jgi:hypothetical protein
MFNAALKVVPYTALGSALWLILSALDGHLGDRAILIAAIVFIVGTAFFTVVSWDASRRRAGRR